jgi:hypothetical protein
MSRNPPKTNELPRHIRNGSHAVMSSSSLDISFATRVLDVSDETLVLANTVPFEMISSFTKSRSFTLLVDLLRIQTDKLESDGKNMVFKAKQIDSVSETRGDERFTFASDENVRCEILNPADEETLLVKQVLDMSASGFSLKTHASSKLFYPGSQFRAIKVMIGSKLYTTRDAVAVYQRKFMDEDGKMYQQAGFKFLSREGA